jgi:aminoglycoside phosphotransferase (APT) family kinase protein
VTSAPRWSAERHQDPAQAEALITAAFPELRGLPIRPLAEGWDNTVYLVGDTWAFRFPRRAIALPGFRRELAVLPRLADLLPLPIPVPDLVADDDDPVEPWPFAGARFLPGRELAEADLPDDARLPAARAVGEFLRALHAVPLASVADSGMLPPDPMQRGWPRARIVDTRQHLDDLVAAGTWAGDAKVDELLTAAERLDAPHGDPVVVHGDLHVRHLLVDGAARAAGVIDWGDVCLADPAVDLALAYTAFTGPARQALLDAYGGIDAEREMRARALGVRLSAFLAGYAAAEHQHALLSEALDGLRRVVQ